MDNWTDFVRVDRRADRESPRWMESLHTRQVGDFEIIIRRRRHRTQTTPEGNSVRFVNPR